MSAELYIHFESVEWYQKNQQIIADYLCSLPCCIRENSSQEFWLLGFEDREHPKRWEFDMRLFFKEQYIFLEISSHPNTVSEDLMILLKWLRAQTIISVQDEDGEPSSW